jgi:hypothetical protein
MRRRGFGEQLPTGVEDEVPYDQTGMMGEETPDPAMSVSGLGGGMDLAALGQDATMPPTPSSMAPTDPALGQDDMAMLDQPEEMPAQEDIEVEEMAAALEDPNTPPEVKQQIEQQLALAARRQLAGLGGQ